MARILAIDYGRKRTGLAWTDPLQIIASPLETVSTDKLKERLKTLFQQESIESIVLGYPTRMDGSDSHVTEDVRQLEAWLQTTFPQVAIHRWDERFTSKRAQQALIEAGVKKKKRREKGILDRTAAVLMLQEYLNLYSG